MSLSQARRVALAAQGLHRERPDVAARAGSGGRAPTMRQVQGVIDRLGLLQIDSVNVLARAHLMPLYARLGPYDTALLDRAAGRAPRRLVETWAHVASYVPPSTWPLLEWRRRRYRTEAWGTISAVEMSHSEAVQDVRRLVTERGPITASEVHEILEAEGRAHPRDRSQWGWNWTVAKRALEFLFFTGEITSARRNGAFERCYDLTERVLPPEVVAAPPVADADAVRALLEIGARAHGVGTLRCFRDYFRLKGPAVRTALDELVEAGTLRPVTVRGWDEPTYLHADAALPRRATATTLLNPFDPLVFERTRLERLFDVHYRIEIYVPAAKRVHGYYVLPFL
ncbi:MAG: winged helix-turn-helix domain-containing protein [Cellulosimicrobium funkei]